MTRVSNSPVSNLTTGHAAVGCCATAWRLDRMAAWLFLPFAVWVAFASLLNASILALN